MRVCVYVLSSGFGSFGVTLGCVGTQVNTLRNFQTGALHLPAFWGSGVGAALEQCLWDLPGAL